MSVVDQLLAGEQVEVEQIRVTATKTLFRDQLGVTLALVCIVWVGLTWRLGFASNDQYTFANTLLAVVDGQLHITQPVYGPASGSTPGTYLVDGRVYGRNYGVVFVSTLWYVVLRLLAAVMDVRVFLTGLWSLALFAVVSRVGTALDYRRAGVLTGTVGAVSAFGLSVLVAEPLSNWWLPLLSLQLTTALAAVVATVTCYRLVADMYDRRVGATAAVTTIVATPVGFWATLPKRHSVTAALVVCSMYTLYRSRTAATARTATRFRALTYVWPALLAWVHAPLGFILLVGIGMVDLPTARSNDLRELVTVGAVFALALLPFFVTNAAISGNPIHPPRFLPSYTGDILSADAMQAQTGQAQTGQATSSNQAGQIDSLVPTPITAIVGRFIGSYAVLLEPGRLFRVFVRTGYAQTLSPSQDAAINLSVLESMPLLGALSAVPALAIRRLTAGPDWVRSPRQWSAPRALDMFTVLFTGLLIGLYLGVLPLHHMLTVRYLHPLYAIGVYWLVRLPAVRHAVRTELRTLVSSYAGTVFLGVPAYLGAIALGGFVLDESVQLYALVALGVAIGVAVWALVGSVGRPRPQVGAVVLGVAAGVMSVYLLVAGLSLFPVTGEFLLPISRMVSERIHYARLIGSSPPF